MAAAIEQRGDASRHVDGATLRTRRGWLHGAGAITLVVGLLATVILSWVAFTARQRNDLRLLKLQTQEYAVALGAAIGNVQTPLRSAAAVAETNDGEVTSFRSTIANYVGTGLTFVSASLWNVQTSTPQLISVVGVAPYLEARPTELKSLFARTVSQSGSGSVGVSAILPGTRPHLAYAATSGNHPSYVVSAEIDLPKNRYASVKRRSAFSELNFALYLGKTPNQSTLIEASVQHLPIPGPTASTIIPFGNSQFIFVASANGELGGTLSEDLWWLIAIVGTAMAVAAGLVSTRLVRSRRKVEEIADENGRLYAQQRGVAETLQHTLLPQELPKIDGVELAVRYVPGVEGLEVGGDWYDVLQVDEDHLLFVVGDVSGRGLRAASFMAEVRYAIRAYALDGDDPAAIFYKLSKVLSIGRDRHFATAMCGRIEMTSGVLEIVSAGHPNGVLRTPTETMLLDVPVGPPIGVSSEYRYEKAILTLSPGSTLLGYTDGLFERRDESVDTGLARIRDLVASSDPRITLDQLVDELINELTPAGPSDDIALLGLKWK